MKKKLTFLCFCLYISMSAQVKKKVSKVDVFDKKFSEQITDLYSIPGDLYDEELPVNGIFDNNIVEEKPIVEYLKVIDSYYYAYKFNDLNISLIIKNNRIISKKIIVFKLNHFIGLLKKFYVLERDFDYNKGFNINNESYLVISKQRNDKYDVYSFELRSPEYYNIMDLLESKKNR